jgi:hypothetical protein
MPTDLKVRTPSRPLNVSTQRLTTALRAVPRCDDSLAVLLRCGRQGSALPSSCGSLLRNSLVNPPIVVLLCALLCLLALCSLLTPDISTQ